jgi:hypothetical protein
MQNNTIAHMLRKGALSPPLTIVANCKINTILQPYGRGMVYTV